MLIEPEQLGPALADDIRTSNPPMGGLLLWRLGQAGVVVKFPQATVIVDAYLSNHCEALLGAPFDHRRLTRAPLEPAEIDFADLVMCTHEHPDHLDVPTLRTLARQLPRAQVVVPDPVTSVVEQLGWVGRTIGATVGQPIHASGLTIEPIPVPHEDYEQVEGKYRYLGYVMSNADVTLAHVGDSMADERLAATLATHRPDVLVLPINGRSAETKRLGFAGNMSAPEAVNLAIRSRADLVVPVHYDMFQQNIQPEALTGFNLLAQETALNTVAAPVGRRISYPKVTASMSVSPPPLVGQRPKLNESTVHDHAQ